MSIVLTDCTVVDAERDEPLRDAGVWTRDGVIAAVGPVDDVLRAARTDGEPQLVELGGSYVMPGLINMHTHLSDVSRETGRETPVAFAYRMAAHARRSVEAGVTTVRLVAEPFGVDFALRRAIEAGDVVGPRVFTAGRAIVCTGGHGFAAAGTIEADGADGFRQAVRAQLRDGADLIKLMISGGIAGEHEGIDTPQLKTDELLAAIEVAHDWGRKVTAHAGPARVISEGIECGLDCIEHGYQLTDEVIRLMVDRGTTLVPTILVTRCEQYYRDVGAPEWLIARALAAGEDHWRALESAIRHGVSIAVGTDMLPAEPQDETTATVRELEHYRDAGMSPRQVLASATTTPAAWLGVTERLGTVTEGKFADLIALDGDPMEDVSALRRLRFVVAAGRIVRRNDEERL
jgi:imidazolonepropionase-like amidohydrolase